MPAFTSIIAGVAGAAAGGGAVASGIMQKDAAHDAAEAQLLASRESIAAQRELAAKAEAFQREQADLARKDLEPFKQAQLQALGQVQGLTQVGNPLEQQERQANAEAIQRQLAAQGLLRSKSQVDLLSNLELGLNQQRFGRLNALANLGAAQGQSQISSGLGSNLGALYGNLGSNVGQTIQQGGAQAAQTRFNGAQAFGQGILGAGNALQGIGQNLLLAKYLPQNQPVEAPRPGLGFNPNTGFLGIPYRTDYRG